jgi:RNA methyltransferase, TrmH family
VSADPISSSSNPLLKRARKLKATKNRARENATLVEGIASVWQALDHGDPETIIVASDLMRSEEAGALLDRAGARGTSVVDVTPEAFASFAERDNPSGLAAIVHTFDLGLADLNVGSGSLFAVLEDVAGPGNLGTIVRTADAVGARVIAVGESTDPWHPACVKASMGTVFSTPVATESGLTRVIEWCRANGVTVVTTSARATHEHWTVTYDLPAAIVMGSERHGLSADMLALGDVNVRIPMSGGASSLNLAVAAGILLYEARRAKR